MKRVLGLLTLLVLLAGCTPGIRGATSSITPLRTNTFTVVAAKAEKTLCTIRVFYLGEPPAVSNAVAQLVAEKQGDAAINVEYEQFVDSTSVLLQIFTGTVVTNTCVKIKADIIKYQ